MNSAQHAAGVYLMKKRIIGLFVVSTALLLAAFSTATAAQYSLAVSKSSLYQVKLDGATMTYTKIYSLGNSYWARSIATYGDKVLVTGVGDSGSTLSVLTLNSSGVAVDKAISLTGVTYAGSIAVDSNHGIYVGDDSGSSAKLAYLADTSGSVITQQISSHAPLLDVATSDNTAVVISRHDSSVSDQSFITTLTGGIIGTTKSLEVGNEYPRYPVAVTAKAGNAYVLSSVNTIPGSGALSKYRLSTGTADPPIALDNFTPTDITTFTLGGTDYLALIGRTSSGQLQAWKSMLSSGSVGTWDKVDLGVDGGLDFQLAASTDGNLLWYTSSSDKYVGALDTATWGLCPNTVSVGDQISGLVGFTTGMTPVTIPEPSSLLALASFGVGAFGLLRKRKSA